MRERLDMLSQVETYVGQFFSKEWVKKNVLKMSDEEIQEIEDQIEKEGDDGDDEFDMGSPFSQDNSADSQPKSEPNDNEEEQIQSQYLKEK